ncbi:MAG TPA: sigma-70 family RNA polymerase sigma factor [Rhodanobacter sp.]
MEEAERELWRRYRQEEDTEARDYLFLRYRVWARQVAAAVYRRLRLAQIDWDDYSQNAQVGLLEAMSRFDVARGVDFVAYAKPRVRGAVFNGLRSLLREEEQRRNRSEHRIERLQSLNASEPDDPLEGFIDSVVGLALGHLLESDYSADSRPAHAMAEHEELGSVLNDVLLTLKARERQLMIAHYFRHVPFQDIAKELGITKGRVSQLHKAALMAMRAELSRRRYDYSSL